MSNVRPVQQELTKTAYPVNQLLFFKLVLTKSVYQRVCLMSLKMLQMSIIPCAQNVIANVKLVLLLPQMIVLHVSRLISCKQHKIIA